VLKESLGTLRVTVVSPGISNTILFQDGTAGSSDVTVRKYWDHDMLPGAIMKKDLLPVLTHRMVKMSKICWRKHVAVVISMLLAVLGGGSLIVCAFLVQFGWTP
jgi:hypothetical protein